MRQKFSTVFRPFGIYDGLVKTPVLVIPGLTRNDVFDNWYRVAEEAVENVGVDNR